MNDAPFDDAAPLNPAPSLREVRELVRQAVHLNYTGEPAPAEEQRVDVPDGDDQWAASTILRVVALAAQLEVEALKAEAVGNRDDAHQATAESDRLYDALAGDSSADPT